MIKPLDKRLFSTNLVGTRIQLKLVSPELSEQVWEFINRDHSAGGELYIWVKSKEDVENYITKKVSENTKEQDYFIIQEDKVIGTINIHTINYLDHKAEIGYSIEKAKEGQGLVTEGVQLIEDEMKRLGFNKLIINCDINNIRSMNVAERNNYKKEGVFIQDCIENGKFRDSVLFGKILR